MMSDSPYNYVRLYNDQDDKTESKIDASTTTAAIPAARPTVAENIEQQLSSNTCGSKNDWRLCNDEVISGVDLAQRITQDSREESEDEDETPKLGSYESRCNEVSRYPFCNDRQRKQQNPRNGDGSLILHRTVTHTGLTLDEKQWLAIGFLSLTVLILVVVFFLI